MSVAHVHGVGLFTAGRPGVGAFFSGSDFDPDVERPVARWLEGPLGRRASALTRIGVEALEQAVGAARFDAKTIATIWATAHGEHETAVSILSDLFAGEGRISPTRFHNSVYNTASGYASIATGNRAPSTTLSGGPDLFAMALLEALCTLQGGTREVAIVMADEPMLAPFDSRAARAPLAIALCLSERSIGSLAELRSLERRRIAPAPRHPDFGGLYVSGALPLLEAIWRRRAVRVPLEIDGGRPGGVWSIEVAPAGERSSGDERC